MAREPSGLRRRRPRSVEFLKRTTQSVTPPLRFSLFVREALLHRERPIGVAACTIRRLRTFIVEAGDDHEPARAGGRRCRLNVRDQRAGYALAAKRRINPSFVRSAAIIRARPRAGVL